MSRTTTECTTKGTRNTKVCRSGSRGGLRALRGNGAEKHLCMTPSGAVALAAVVAALSAFDPCAPSGGCCCGCEDAHDSQINTGRETPGTINSPARVCACGADCFAGQGASCETGGAA